MINAFYSSVSGSRSFQSSLDVTANNIANANTTGYKAQQANFADLIYTGIAATGGGTPAIETGNGTKVSNVSTAIDTGSITDTGREYDYAVLGNGYFGVMDANGSIYYTRDGNFYLSNTEDGLYLVTSEGDRVLNADLSPVKIDHSAGDAAVGNTATEENLSGQTGVPGVFTFANPYALTINANGRFNATVASGQAAAAPQAKIKQGSLEGSNVDLTKEMADLMNAQKGFEFSAKVIQAADEMENIANTLR